MTPEQEQGLREMQADLAAASRGDHEPRCVALAFASPGISSVAFTMQMWIDLEAQDSPLLRGEPVTDPSHLAFLEALFAIPLDPDRLTVEEGCDCLNAMRAAIERGFSMSLRMRPPRSSEEGDAQGFGSWLPIFACLVTECGLAPDVARHMDVGQAFAIIAAHRHNQGWNVSGTPYALRDAKEVSNG